MKQKIIIYCLGLITGLGIWFAYDRIEAYRNSISIKEFYNQYERDGFIAEDKSPEFVAKDVYEMKLVSNKDKETSNELPRGRAVGVSQLTKI